MPKYIEVWANVSAYTADEGGNIGNDGKNLAYGDIAMDDFPNGTKVEIEGEVFVVNDCFGGQYTNHIDIFMGSYKEAISFGRRMMKVKIYTGG